MKLITRSPFKASQTQVQPKLGCPNKSVIDTFVTQNKAEPETLVPTIEI